jgi:threonine/homoserine/homoserine lactone efflux protein
MTMLETHNLIAFMTAALALNLAPGPDMLYVIGRSLSQGRLAGYVSSLGIFVGCLVHIFAAAFGLAALLQTSETAFAIVRWAGAAYMVYLGIRILRTPPASFDVPTQPTGELRTIFMQGVLTNVLNPKVALFFLAFLPQFVSPSAESPIRQTLMLGLIFNIGGTLVNLIIAFFAASAGSFLQRDRRAAEAQRWITGSIFLGLALRLAIQKRTA